MSKAKDYIHNASEKEITKKYIDFLDYYDFRGKNGEDNHPAYNFIDDYVNNALDRDTVADEIRENEGLTEDEDIGNGLYEDYVYDNCWEDLLLYVAKEQSPDWFENATFIQWLNEQ